jgi:DNA-damage-inducible protein D
MDTDLVVQLTGTFEGHAQHTETGVEYWLARDLQHLLGYTEWRNFLNVLSKGRTACAVSGHAVAHHFVDVNKMVELSSGRRPELPAPDEDIRKVERRVASDERKSLAKPDRLED